jgi:hypothetical protein
MPKLTLDAAGSREPLATGTTPTQVFCNRVTIQLISGTTVYLGLQRPLGSSDAVSSTVNDIVLTSANPSFTIGPTSGGNSISLTSVFWDSDTTGAVIDIAPVTV